MTFQSTLQRLAPLRYFCPPCHDKASQIERNLLDKRRQPGVSNTTPSDGVGERDMPEPEPESPTEFKERAPRKTGTDEKSASPAKEFAHCALWELRVVMAHRDPKSGSNYVFQPGISTPSQE